MSFLDRLERALGRFAIPNISLYFVIGQVFVLLMFLLGRLDLGLFVFRPAQLLAGEWWRAFTFLLMPPPPGMFGYLLIAFAWYLFYLMGSALEGFWGVFRYNLFLLIGWVLTVGMAFFSPHHTVTNLFLAGSVFLAFAYLNPNFEMLLFFILPVKIKWLALLTWVGYGVQCFVGDMSDRLQILAAVGNFLLFFAGDILRSARSGQRRMARKAQEFAAANEARHTCVVCKKTDRTHPQLDFRYCSKCAGDQCFCPEHIHAHAHVTAADAPKTG